MTVSITLSLIINGQRVEYASVEEYNDASLREALATVARHEDENEAKDWNVFRMTQDIEHYKSFGIMNGDDFWEMLDAEAAKEARKAAYDDFYEELYEQDCGDSDRERFGSDMGC